MADKNFDYAAHNVIAPANQDEKRKMYSWAKRNVKNESASFEDKWIAYARATGKVLQGEGLKSEEVEKVIEIEETGSKKGLDESILQNPAKKEKTVAEQSKQETVSEIVNEEPKLQYESAKKPIITESFQPAVGVDDTKPSSDSLLRFRVFYGINRKDISKRNKYYISIPRDYFPDNVNFDIDPVVFTFNEYSQEIRYWMSIPANYVEIGESELKTTGRIVIVNRL